MAFRNIPKATPNGVRVLNIIVMCFEYYRYG
jgi:hypothetical protein